LTTYQLYWLKTCHHKLTHNTPTQKFHIKQTCCYAQFFQNFA